MPLRRRPLKPEGRYGMGDASVSWHSDSSLQNLSTVAVPPVRRGIESRDDSWHVALRARRGEPRRVDVPPSIIATYYMARDFNANHHHAVLAGNTRRFSSTHRVAVVARDTFEYIKRSACEGALALLPRLKAAAEGARGTETAANGASCCRQLQQRRRFRRWARLTANGGVPVDSHVLAAGHAPRPTSRGILDAPCRGTHAGIGHTKLGVSMALGRSGAAERARGASRVRHGGVSPGEVRELREEHAKSESGAYALVPEDCRR